MAVWAASRALEMPEALFRRVRPDAWRGAAGNHEARAPRAADLDERAVVLLRRGIADGW